MNRKKKIFDAQFEIELMNLQMNAVKKAHNMANIRLWIVIFWLSGLSMYVVL